MKSDAPDSRAQQTVEHARLRGLVSEARASLRDSARLVARAALAVHADTRAMRVFAQAVELTDEYLARALDDLARASGQT